ncbi:patatin family protein [Salinivibrio sp. ES.052]|uniref:patatin-like phospholipase family protein n=1 Tax=Salinivibrio sp. ES.052 TaxID=1882823 RepID=UPI0009262D3A|nr:patatin family protein [Salinivibrio sp. ES.052]SIN87577.1 Predicted phospholipase, patatin/cPLA2 family [Salinivibrio sp. ES.052]
MVDSNQTVQPSALTDNALAAGVQSGAYSRPQRLSLVLQGGGQRGIFTAGVLDAFLTHHFDPFELYFGTSAGALNMSAYVCQQYQYGYRFITQLTTQERFFHLMKYVRRQHHMDLDWALDKALPGKDTALDMEVARRHLQHRYAYACATDVDTLQPAFFSLVEDNWPDALKATCAIPLLYPDPVNINDHRYVDGGVTAAIPAKEAFARGADIIVVIRTEPTVEQSKRGDDSGRFLETLRTRFENKKPQFKLSDYLSNFESKYRLARFETFQKELSKQLGELSDRYKSSREQWVNRVRDNMREKAIQNGGRWLFGGDTIYRLQSLSGKPLNTDMLRMFTTHYQSYQSELQFLATPPARTQILQIAPSAPLQSSALLSKPEALEADYQLGLALGNQFLRQYGESLVAISSVGNPEFSSTSVHVPDQG